MYYHNSCFPFSDFWFVSNPFINGIAQNDSSERVSFSSMPSEEEATIGEASDLERPQENREVEIDQTINGVYSRKAHHIVLNRKEDEQFLESKGFGVREASLFYLRDYEVLYLIFTKKMKVEMEGSEVSFEDFVSFSSKRDHDAWARFLIFRDLRTRGYVVREGFGFPIDFRVYDRGDYGTKAAKYIVFGLNEGKTMSVADLKLNVEQMATMGKEAVVAVVERRGEVIYYKVGKWYPQKPI
jgi:tRNA-intron endonuclease, archaea type